MLSTTTRMDYPDSHLQSAIRSDERRLIFKEIDVNKCPSFLLPYRLTSPIPKDSNLTTSGNTYGHLLSQVYYNDGKILNWVKHYFPPAVKASCKAVYSVLSVLIPGFNYDHMMLDKYSMNLISFKI